MRNFSTELHESEAQFIKLHIGVVRSDHSPFKALRLNFERKLKTLYNIIVTVRIRFMHLVRFTTILRVKAMFTVRNVSVVV